MNTTRADPSRFNVLENFSIDLIYEQQEGDIKIISNQQEYVLYINSLSQKSSKFRNYITALIGFKNIIDTGASA